MNAGSQTGTFAFLFTDVEGSIRLWEQEPERMKGAMAHHDTVVRAAVEDNRGTVIKMTGTGVYAVFEDALDGVRATLQLQLAIAGAAATSGLALRVRCGMHSGEVERRDNDYFGSVINRAARIEAAAHGGQVLVSEAVAAAVRERLPEGVGLRELGSVRLRGLETAERVYQVLHPRLRQDFPALSALESTPNNLPEHDTSLVDRERELAEVGELLGQTRLLTLLGTVGVGKSRLALQVALDAMDDFPDGVWHVELAGMGDPALVERAVARALSVQEEPGVALQKTLAAHVAARRLLLVLDNCARLLEACARIADALLRAAPALRILATSREALRVPGEQTYIVRPLPLPRAEDRGEGAGAEAPAAIRLFVERAREQRPDFTLTGETMPVVTSLCRRLDGIPLAIELAAARLGACTLEAIAARVAEHRLLAKDDGAGASETHRRLRAKLDRTYDQLEEGERLLFNRLSVFEGAFDLEAAEQVCGAPPLSSDDVLDLLTALADRSLVAIDAGGERSLFRQYEILRDYARERGADSPGGAADIEATRARHAELASAPGATAA